MGPMEWGCFWADLDGGAGNGTFENGAVFIEIEGVGLVKGGEIGEIGGDIRAGVTGDPVLDPGLKMGYFVSAILKLALYLLVLWWGRWGVLGFWWAAPGWP